MKSKEVIILNSLINFNEPIEKLKKQTKSLPWDLEEKVELTDSILCTILDRFIAGQITAVQLEEWANLVESRESILVSDKSKEAIYKLANPALEGEITKESITEIQRGL